jgi:hypothetical protein
MPLILTTWEDEIRKIDPGQPGQKAKSCLQNNKSKMGYSVTQVIKHLPSKHEAQYGQNNNKKN